MDVISAYETDFNHLSTDDCDGLYSRRQPAGGRPGKCGTTFGCRPGISRRAPGEVRKGSAAARRNRALNGPQKALNGVARDYVRRHDGTPDAIEGRYPWA